MEKGEGFGKSALQNAHEALRKLEEKYFVLAKNIHEGILVIQDKLIKFANARAEEISGYPREELTSLSMVLEALKAGALGYLNKESAPDRLVSAIRTILARRKYVSPSLAEKLAFELDKDSQVSKAVAEMDKVVQQNAANAEESAAAAEEMNSQAEQMKAYMRELDTIVGGRGKDKAGRVLPHPEEKGKITPQVRGENPPGKGKTPRKALPSDQKAKGEIPLDPRQGLSLEDRDSRPSKRE